MTNRPSELLLHQDKAAATREHYRVKAAELVDGNREKYPELLTEQLGTAMYEAATLTDSIAQMRFLVGVCLRMVERANVKPQGDEQIAVELAAAMTDADPRRMGGNGWLNADQLRIDLDLGEAA